MKLALHGMEVATTHSTLSLVNLTQVKSGCVFVCVCARTKDDKCCMPWLSCACAMCMAVSLYTSDFNSTEIYVSFIEFRIQSHGRDIPQTLHISHQMANHEAVVSTYYTFSYTAYAFISTVHTAQSIACFIHYLHIYASDVSDASSVFVRALFSPHNERKKK